MKKKYLMNAVAVLALGLTAASCSKDLGVSKSDIVGNAESALGVKIAPDHDWIMTQNVTARITVNLGTGEDYTLYVYDKSPFDNDDAVYFSKQAVMDASVTDLSLSLPSYLTEVYISVFDSKGASVSKRVAVSGDVLMTVFGKAMAESYTLTRSMTSPEVKSISAPYDEAWVTEYLTTATEPTSSNVANNDSGAGKSITKTVVMPNFQPGNKPQWCQYNQSLVTEDDIKFYNNTFKPLLDAYYSAPQEYSTYNNEENYVKVNNAKIDKFLELYNAVVTYAGESGVSDWLNITTMPEKGIYGAGDYVTNFKITGTWNGGISVAGSEGSSSPGSERTIVVTGTWNITEDQRIGSLGKIIIANGGVVNVADGKKLDLNNQAQLVVLSGGKLTGSGNVKINNGTAEGYENYNGGTIDVANFNNNFGKFYNYGKFLVNEYDAGSTESNFYNHSLVAIDHTGNTPNARIFNACQFYVANDARLRNYEGVQGSALIVDGQLMPFGSADGSSTPSYVSLAAGALVQAGSLYNGSSWIGPTEGGYAVLKIGQFDYMNWEKDPRNGGYFINNIYLLADDLSNVPAGKGMQQANTGDVINHGLSTAQYKFANIVANAGGNGNTKIVQAGDDEIIPGDAGFVKGEKGCTPGVSITIPDDEDTDTPIEQEEVHEVPPAQEPGPAVYTYAFEDTFMGDYDMNDVVLQVWEENNKLKIRLCATGASKDLYVYYNNNPLFQRAEVHQLFGAAAGKFVNTGASGAGDKFTTVASANWPVTEMSKPSGFDYATAGFNIRWGNLTRDESIWLTTCSDSPIGTAPYAVCIPDKWAWPTEWTKVSEAYPGNSTYPSFADYAGDPSKSTWYKAPDVSKTISPE